MGQCNSGPTQPVAGDSGPKDAPHVVEAPSAPAKVEIPKAAPEPPAEEVSKPEPTTQSKPVEADESIGNIIGKDSVPSGDRVEPLERLMPDSKTGFLDDYTFGEVDEDLLRGDLVASWKTVVDRMRRRFEEQPITPHWHMRFPSSHC